MRALRLIFSAYLCCFLRHASSTPTRFGEEGIEVDAGSLGGFTLHYPALLDAQQKPVHKFASKRASGLSADLQYEDGGSARITLGENGSVLIAFINSPEDVKFVEVNMLIPISFNQGGKWMIGGKKAPFPKEKPAAPHLYQGHAPSMRIANYEGRILEIKAPQYSYLQLSDNREWNWPIFNWKSTTPLDTASVNDGRRELTFMVSVTAAPEGAKAAALVDQFGQSTREDWPQKVKSADELSADVSAEKAYYDDLEPPPLDAYGGLPDSGKKLALKATGFFHVEKKGERWLLVDPAGNAFFHLGLCSANPNEDYTMVKGRESAYAWLPPRDGAFASAYKSDSGGSVVSFHLANMIRKYGQPFDIETYTARMIPRMKKWGFNSIGAFSNVGEQAQRAAQFPRVAHLPLSQWNGITMLPGVNETFDPFDEKTRAQIEENFAKLLPSAASDPLIIGYFIANEPIYENVPHMLPALDGNHACKREFVRWLETKYQDASRLQRRLGSNARGRFR